MTSVRHKTAKGNHEEVEGKPQGNRDERDPPMKMNMFRANEEEEKQVPKPHGRASAPPYTASELSSTEPLPQTPPQFYNARKGAPIEPFEPEDVFTGMPSESSKPSTENRGGQIKPFEPESASCEAAESSTAPSMPQAPPPPYTEPTEPPRAFRETEVPKKTTTDCLELFIVTVSLGWLGIHWFWLGRPTWGLLYLCTCGLFGVGWAIDILRLPNLVARSKSGFDSDDSVDLFDMWILCICPITGLFCAAHHFAMRRTAWAVFHVFTLGFLGVGWGIDILRMPHLVFEHNKLVAAAKATLSTKSMSSMV